MDHIGLPFMHEELLCVRYHTGMKTPPDSPEFAKFSQAMRDILGVSKEEMQRRMDEEKQERGREAKTSSSGRASGDKD